nr:TPA_asm: ND4L [Gammarus fossarum]
MMVCMETAIIVGVVSSIFSFILNYSHVLNSLLSLELLVLMVYWLLSLNLFNMGGDSFFMVFYVVMSVCEGVLGLSLLIMGVYSHGSDYMMSYSVLNC